MYHVRRKDKEVKDSVELKKALREAEHVTLAMSLDDEPYLVTLSHGYDEERNCIYFHCAREGKKIDILMENPIVWGQALIDMEYQQGSCDHLFQTTQFRGRVTFIKNIEEKKNALEIMIKQLDENPQTIIEDQMKPTSIQRVQIGRIDIDYMSGKRADKVNISL